MTPRASPFVADSSRNRCAFAHDTEGRLHDDRTRAVAWRHADRQTCAGTQYRTARLPRPQLRAVVTGEQAMSVTVRKYQGGTSGRWTFGSSSQTAPSIRERKKAPVSGKRRRSAGPKARERELVMNGKPKRSERGGGRRLPTLTEFAPRFMDGYARANRQKPSGIAAKESILRSI